MKTKFTLKLALVLVASYFLGIQNGFSQWDAAWQTYVENQTMGIIGRGGINPDFIVRGRMKTGDVSNLGGLYLNNAETQFVGQIDANRLGFWNNGWRFAIDNLGKVGIGTISPTSALTVNGDIKTTGYLHLNNDETQFLGHIDAHTIGIYNENGWNLAMAGGFVGIGTTSPEYPLHVKCSYPRSVGLQVEGSGAWVGTNTKTTTSGAYPFYGYETQEGKLATHYLTTAGDWKLRLGSVDKLTLLANGNFLINKTSQTNSVYKLDVNGSARVNEIVVNTTGADFVFDEDYKLPSLSETETYVKANKHLQGIPSAKEMQEEGMKVGELQITLLQKVEELTLHLIKINAHVSNLEKENMALKNSIQKIEAGK
jgi:hypothetical protein